jgi:hypothetical protein
MFFVSVASKGVNHAVSLLFATLAGRFISVAAKGLTGVKSWRERSGGLGWEYFEGEGEPGGRVWASINTQKNSTPYLSCQVLCSE